MTETSGSQPQASDAKHEVKTQANVVTPSEVTPQLVKRVHELYEELGREDVRAAQNWDKAQREIGPDGSHE
jgi:H+-transporting ATPase